MGLYENIKAVAKARGISLNRLEKELNFPRSYIAKFRTITPGMDKVQRIADYLEVSVDRLVSGSESQTYYFDDESAEIAQQIYSNPGLRLLFDASRNATPDDLQTAISVLNALKKKGSEEDGR